jgi:hypothetical protein
VGGARQCRWKKATDFFHDSKRYLQLTWSAAQRFAFCNWGTTEGVERSRAECWRLGLGSRGRCCRNLGFILLLSRWASGQQRATGFDLSPGTVEIPDGTIHSRSEPPSCSYFLLPFFLPSLARHLAALGHVIGVQLAASSGVSFVCSISQLHEHSVNLFRRSNEENTHAPPHGQRRSINPKSPHDFPACVVDADSMDGRSGGYHQRRLAVDESLLRRYGPSTEL